MATTLTIEGPDGTTQEIELELSDSRGNMSDFSQISKALGLAEDADEAKILEAIAARPALDADKVAEALGIEDTDTDAVVAKVKELSDVKPLADGDVAVKREDLDQLKHDVAEGKQAAADLKQGKFDGGFKDALEGGRVDAKDETRERFQKLYDLDAETTLETLKNLPKIVNTEAAGSGEGSTDAPEGVDADRHDLDVAVQARMRDKSCTYEEALEQVLADRSQS